MVEKDEALQERYVVEKVIKGDSHAFRELYDLTYGKVSRYVHRLVRDDDLVEDILIQTYTIGWQRIHTYKKKVRVSTWLIGIARNVSFREFKKLRKTVPFNDEYSAADEDSQYRVEINSTKEALKKALQSLNTIHREILELVFYQDFSYAEISELIDIPVNTVKTRVFHAKKALKLILQRQDISE